MLKRLFISAIAFACSNAESQVHGGLEQYYYTGVKQSAVVPKIYYETSKDWYGEVHYNYEAFETVSCNVGKSFKHNGVLSLSVTPFIGGVLGQINGTNLGGNVVLEYKKLFFTAESQYTISLQKKSDNFFYSWSEAGYNINDFLYTGFALQVTHLFEQENYWQPGAMLGLCYKSIAIPLYAFVHNHTASFVIGVNWEWKKNENEDL